MISDTCRSEKIQGEGKKSHLSMARSERRRMSDESCRSMQPNLLCRRLIRLLSTSVDDQWTDYCSHGTTRIRRLFWERTSLARRRKSQTNAKSTPTDKWAAVASATHREHMFCCLHHDHGDALQSSSTQRISDTNVTHHHSSRKRFLLPFIEDRTSRHWCTCFWDDMIILRCDHPT